MKPDKNSKTRLFCRDGFFLFSILFFNNFKDGTYFDFRHLLIFQVDAAGHLDLLRPVKSEGAVAKTCPYGVYTIVEERNGYGKLKSGAGWLKLSAVAKV